MISRLNFQLVAGVVCALFSLTSCGEKEVKRLVATSSAQINIPEFREDIPYFSGENAYNRTACLVSLGERQVGSEELEKSIQFIEKELIRFGWSTKRQSFTEKTVIGEKTFVNLRARLSGDVDFSLSPTGVIGCHIDTKVMPFVFVSANDGASHTAVMLELARLMKNNPSQWDGVELVFFDGEESFGEHMDPDTEGLYGSRHYVKSLEGKLPHWMVNLDMLGARDLKIAIPQETDPKLFLLYKETIAELNESSEVFGVAYSNIWDDHYPFYMEGVPTINFIADFYEGGWWHTSKDNMSIISADSLGRSGKFIWRYLNKLSPIAESGKISGKEKTR